MAWSTPRRKEVKVGMGSPAVGVREFLLVNEKPVDEVSLNFFYQPRTLTLLCLVIAALVYVVFTR
jgi:hypothetical protein